MTPLLLRIGWANRARSRRVIRIRSIRLGVGLRLRRGPLDKIAWSRPGHTLRVATTFLGLWGTTPPGRAPLPLPMTESRSRPWPTRGRSNQTALCGYLSSPDGDRCFYSRLSTSAGRRSRQGPANKIVSADLRGIARRVSTYRKKNENEIRSGLVLCAIRQRIYCACDSPPRIGIRMKRSNPFPPRKPFFRLGGGCDE